MSYIYNDEDNAPMNDEFMPIPGIEDEHGQNPTVYTSLTEAKAWENGEQVPFDDPPADGCWNCMNFDWKHEACTLNWNNMDESYYNPDCDDRKLTDCCEDHETDPDAVWEDIFDDGTDT